MINNIMNYTLDCFLTSTSDRGLDEWIQLLVSSDGQLQVARGDTLHFKIFGRISCQLQHLKQTGPLHTFT